MTFDNRQQETTTFQEPPEPDELEDYEVEVLLGILDGSVVTEIDLALDEEMPEDIRWRGVIQRVDMTAET
jgi:hypothetical protein